MQPSVLAKVQALFSYIDGQICDIPMLKEKIRVLVGSAELTENALDDLVQHVLARMPEPQAFDHETPTATETLNHAAPSRKSERIQLTRFREHAAIVQDAPQTADSQTCHLTATNGARRKRRSLLEEKQIEFLKPSSITVVHAFDDTTSDERHAKSNAINNLIGNSSRKQSLIFTQADDELIIAAVGDAGDLCTRWTLIAKDLFDGRFTSAQVAQRYRRVLKPRVKGCRGGSWSPEEEAMLLSHQPLAEGGQWATISNRVGTRSSPQCHYWWRIVSRDTKTPWTAKEDDALRGAVESLHKNSHRLYCEDWKWLQREFSKLRRKLMKQCVTRTPASILKRCQELQLKLPTAEVAM